MRLSLTAFLLFQSVFGPCNASPLTRLQPRATTASVTQVVVTTTSGSSTWSQTFTPTRLTKYASATGPTTVTSTDKAGKVVLIGVFAGGLAWVGLAGPKPIPPPPTPPPEPPEPPEPGDDPKHTEDKPKETPTTSELINTKPAQTPFIHEKRVWKEYESFRKQKPVKAPHDVTNCAEVSGPTVQRSIAVDKIKGFCKNNKDKKIDNEGIQDTPYVGRGLVLSLSTKWNEICPAKLANSLRHGDCEWLLKSCLDNCDTNTLKKHGSFIKDGCFIWGAIAQEYEGDLECEKERGINDDRGVKRDDVAKSIKEFCANPGGETVNPDRKLSRQYYYETGNSAAELSVSFSHDSDQCPDHIPEYEVDQAACERFLLKAVDGCDTNQVTAKYGGTVRDHCGVFRVKTKNVEAVFCGIEEGDIIGDVNDVKSMTRAQSLEAIDHICGEKIKVDPDFKVDLHNFHQKAEGSGQAAYTSFGQIVVRFQASFNGGFDDKDCPKGKLHFIQREECVRKMKVLIDSCDTGTTTKKRGGLLLDKTAHGCVRWTLYAQRAVNEK
ncbi:hypothetical protein DIZ76_012371 [Coccidioides immitis]|nr:hypothetical protein DIZ76_012371 [Coccidioides immitis]